MTVSQERKIKEDPASTLRVIDLIKKQNEELKHNAEQALIYLKRVDERECSIEAWNLIDSAAEFLEI